MDLLPELVVDAYQKGGYIGVASVAVTLGVTAFRSDAIQNSLPPTLRWDNWGRFQKWLFVVATSYLGGSLHAMTSIGGVSWGTVFFGGLKAALGAMGLRETIKAIRGDAARPPSLKTLRDFPVS